MPSFIRPTYKIVMEEFSSWRPCLGCFHSSRRFFADGGYQGPQFAKALAKVLPHLDVEIVERSIAWLNRCRRLAKDWENLNRKALAFLRLASNPPHAQKTLQSGLNSPDRLLQRAVTYDRFAERHPARADYYSEMGRPVQEMGG